MTQKRKMSQKQIMNLKQFKNKPVEEVEEQVREIVEGIQLDFQEEKRVQDYLDKMAEDYDLTDLNQNDRTALSDLAKISIDIEDLEKRYREKLAEENPDWYEAEKISNALKTHHADRAKIEYDLNITRRSRTAAEDSSPVTLIEDWKKRAKKMLEERLNYVYCPKCHMLLSNVWFLYPNSGNSLTLTCGKESCGHKFTITGSELITHKNRNIEDVLET